MKSRTAKVLLVEDSISDQKLIQQWFQTSDVVEIIHTVSDGDEALNWLQRKDGRNDDQCPDLIMLDLNVAQGQPGRETQLTAPSITAPFLDDVHPKWSTDGNYVIFSRQTHVSIQTDAAVYTIKKDTTELTAITTAGNGNVDEFPAWIKTGNHITFLRNKQVFAIKTDGTELVQVTKSTFLLFYMAPKR